MYKYLSLLFLLSQANSLISMDSTHRTAQDYSTIIQLDRNATPQKITYTAKIDSGDTIYATYFLSGPKVGSTVVTQLCPLSTTRLTNRLPEANYYKLMNLYKKYHASKTSWKDKIKSLDYQQEENEEKYTVSLNNQRTVHATQSQGVIEVFEHSPFDQSIYANLKSKYEQTLSQFKPAWFSGHYPLPNSTNTETINITGITQSIDSDHEIYTAVLSPFMMVQVTQVLTGKNAGIIKACLCKKLENDVFYTLKNIIDNHPTQLKLSEKIVIYK